MASVNKVILIGNLGRDPEMRFTPSGQAVANFSVATSEQWNDKQGQRQERVQWHRVVVWGKQAELCGEYLSKGRQVYLEGRLQTRDFTDRDGNKRSSTEIVVTQVTFLGSRGDAPGGGRRAPSGEASGGYGGGYGGNNGGGGGGYGGGSGSDGGQGSGGGSGHGGGGEGGDYDYGPPPSDDDVPF